MKSKTKIAILLVAVIITLAGFNLMISPSAIDIMRLGRPTPYHVDVTVTAQYGSDAQPISVGRTWGAHAVRGSSAFLLLYFSPKEPIIKIKHHS